MFTIHLKKINQHFHIFHNISHFLFSFISRVVQQQRPNNVECKLQNLSNNNEILLKRRRRITKPRSANCQNKFKSYNGEILHLR